MPDPAMLVKVEDSAGRWMLGKSTGSGREMLAVNGCEGPCCAGGGCDTARKYIACALTTTTEPCAAGPLIVWVCLPVECEKGAVVKWQNRCYKPQVPVDDKPITELDDDAILLRNDGGDPDFRYTCLPDCDDPACTECRTYLRASPCGFVGDGIGGGGGPIPLVYIRRELVGCCGTIGLYANSQGTAWCFTVSPSADGVREDQLPPGAQISDGPVQCGLDCCDCYNTCGAAGIFDSIDCLTGNVTPFRCCCPAKFTATVRYFFFQTIFETPLSSGRRVEIRADGTGTYSFLNGVLTPPGTVDVTQTQFDGSGNIENVTTYQMQLPTWFCGQPFGPVDPDNGFGSTVGIPGQIKCYYEVQPDSGIDRAVRRVSCLSAFVDGASHVTNVNGTVLRTEMTIEWIITNLDPCGSNCTGGTATGGRGLAAVPPDQWPLWAKALAKFRQHGDKGIGSTIERNLGFVGEAYKEAVKRLTGASCGCSSRAGRLNQQFPYT